MCIYFYFILCHFSMKFMLANRIAPDGTPRFAASHLGLFCMPMSHKNDARLIWVNIKVQKQWKDFYEKSSVNFCDIVCFFSA